MNTNTYEILVCLSDQHAAPVAGFMGDPFVRTPHLDRLASESSVFHQAYTACPLCVPARAAMMTGRMPSEIGVFGNSDAFSSQCGTFVHGLSAAGYETVLCGRMHFVGEEQSHGFERRIARDFSPSRWGNPSENRPEMGDFGRSLYQKWCLEVIGEGESPVRAYDRYVTDHAIDYLSQNHSRPQMMLVGTYAPHFPYVGDPARMAYYREKLASAEHSCSPSFSMDAVAGKRQYPSREDLIELRSAYYAMVEEMDEQIGRVYAAWRDYLNRRGHKGIFVYLSDHGDQIGVKDLFGKQTFFEYSAKIPMIIHIDGVEPRDVELPASITDLGTTLCGLTGAVAPPLSRGTDWAPWLLRGAPVQVSTVCSEYFDKTSDGRANIGIMLRRDRWKYISYSAFPGQELLFDLQSDPEEQINLASIEQEIAASFASQAALEQHSRKLLLGLWAQRQTDTQYLDSCEQKSRPADEALWIPPEAVRYTSEHNKRPQYRR